MKSKLDPICRKSDVIIIHVENFELKSITVQIAHVERKNHRENLTS